jgi:tellurite resistance protein TehA-like permease
MGLLQRADNDIRAEGVAPVERQRKPARDENGRKAPDRVHPRRSALATLIFDLPGGSFAFVMATGIVSIAAMRLGHGKVGTVLFAVNLVAFPLLWLVMLVRVFRHPVAILGELRSHRTGAGFLTAVAATSILGDQFVLFASNGDIAATLWLASLILWVSLIYTFFVSMTIKPVKPGLATGLDGAWLLTVVAAESIAILATHISDVFSRSEMVVFVGLYMFLLGGVLYLIFISLIVQRWLFKPMQPEQLTLPYWINMGAAAITTLAGVRLESIAGASPLTARIAQFIDAATVLFWVIATWWIPLLVTLLIWRHIVRGIRPSFRLEYWSMVFPLGMYTAATWALSHQSGTEFLAVIPRLGVWIALASWLLGFVSMTRHLSFLLYRGQRSFAHGNAQARL